MKANKSKHLDHRVLTLALKEVRGILKVLDKNGSFNN